MASKYTPTTYSKGIKKHYRKTEGIFLERLVWREQVHFDNSFSGKIDVLCPAWVERFSAPILEK